LEDKYLYLKAAVNSAVFIIYKIEIKGFCKAIKNILMYNYIGWKIDDL